MVKTVKPEILKRLSIAEGHLKKVIEMVQNDEYCPDIIHQSRAVQAALKKVDEVILHGHLYTCVLKDLPVRVNKKERLIDEIVEVFKKNP